MVFGIYSASYLPSIFVPMLAISAFTVMGLFFLYVEAEG